VSSEEVARDRAAEQKSPDKQGFFVGEKPIRPFTLDQTGISYCDDEIDVLILSITDEGGAEGQENREKRLNHA